jgi:opacity protein-like surface antigen
MIALALALSLVAAGGPDDLAIPRSMSFDDFRPAAPIPVEPAAAADFRLFAEVHLGIAGAYDADNPCFVFGGGVRAHILPWLGADATMDFQTKQKVADQVSIFQVPFEFAALFYAPVDWPIRPYALAGLGFTITDITVPGNDQTDLNLLFFLGFGAEFELSPNLFADANLRFVFAQDPRNTGDFSADWIQFTVGILLKLSK